MFFHTEVVDHADSKETGEHDDKKDTTRDSTGRGHFLKF